MFFYNYLTFDSDIKLKELNHLYNNMKYRSRTEIVGDILDAANGKATQTKIIYVAFLGYNPLRNTFLF